MEYSSPNGTKRGYVKSTFMSGIREGVLAEVTSNRNVYMGPDVSYTQKGVVGAGELVVIINWDETYYHTEYNTTSGRKRGYVKEGVFDTRFDPKTETIIGKYLSVAQTAQEIKDNNLKPPEGGTPDIYYNYTTTEDGVTKNNRKTAEVKITLDVYTGPDSDFVKAGTVYAGERITILRPDRQGYVFIEYCVSGSSAKRGFIKADQAEKLTYVLDVDLNSDENKISGATVETYGSSERGRPLQYYKIGTGNNLLMAVFAIHGYEDAWMRDGEELFKLGRGVASYLASDAAKAHIKEWTVCIIATANPDGLLDGWTNNGPGRTSVGYGKINGYDLNRNFELYFKANSSNRNNTNGNVALQAKEAKALNALLKDMSGKYSKRKILLDVHGWMNITQGNAQIGNYFNKELGLSYAGDGLGQGFLIGQGVLNGFSSTLVELPLPANMGAIWNGNDNYLDQLTRGFINILRNEAVREEYFISLGCSGSDVKALQNVLVDKFGFKLYVDGIFGAETDAAVRKFQEYNGITIDGIVGKETWSALGIVTNNGKFDESLNRDYWLLVGERYWHKRPEPPQWALSLRDYLGNSLNYALFGEYGGEPTLLGHLGQLFLGTESYHDFVSLFNSLKNFKLDWKSFANVSLNSLALVDITGIIKNGDDYLVIAKNGPSGGKLLDDGSKVYKINTSGANTINILLRNNKKFGEPLSNSIDEINKICKSAEAAAGAKLNEVKKLDSSRFKYVNDVSSFERSIPSNCSVEAWKPSSNILEGHDKYVWTDAYGNKWFAETHGIDTNATSGSNAATGWIYRVSVKIGGSGQAFYLASDGQFYSSKMFNPNSPYYVGEDLINSTHIPINK